MTDTTYNGWANYATWRINLELFNDIDWSDYLESGITSDELGADWCEEWVEEVIFSMSDNNNGLIEDYARAFLNGVDWNETAKHCADALKECEDLAETVK